MYVQIIIPERLHCIHSPSFMTQHTRELVFPDVNASRNQIWSHKVITEVTKTLAALYLTTLSCIFVE